MALVEATTFEAPVHADSLSTFSAVAEELRRWASDLGLHRDEAGRKLIEDLLAMAATADQEIAEKNERIRILESLSITDELTGLLNRRGFYAELDRALARSRREIDAGVLLLCDLNRFKDVNDCYGHPAGDAVLCAVANMLLRLTRRNDYAARLGGDEFAVLMASTCPDQAAERARNLMMRVNRLRITWQDRTIPVSAAFGLQAYDQTSCPARLFTLADQELYRNKRPTMLKAV